jgi:hypothetical protein
VIQGRCVDVSNPVMGKAIDTYEISGGSLACAKRK